MREEQLPGSQWTGSGLAGGSILPANQRERLRSHDALDQARIR